jgi:hypothetical protein
MVEVFEEILLGHVELPVILEDQPKSLFLVLRKTESIQRSHNIQLNDIEQSDTM